MKGVVVHICYYHPGLNQEYLALGIHTFSPFPTEFRKARMRVSWRGAVLLLLALMEDLLISHDNSLALTDDRYLLCKLTLPDDRVGGAREGVNPSKLQYAQL